MPVRWLSLLPVVSMVLGVGACGSVRSPELRETTQTAENSLCQLSRVLERLKVDAPKQYAFRSGGDGPWLAHNDKLGLELRVVGSTMSLAPKPPLTWASSFSVEHVGRSDGVALDWSQGRVGVRSFVLDQPVSGGVEHWIKNHPEGIQHGFRIAQKPVGQGPIEVRIRVQGLEPVLGGDGSVLLTAVDRRPVLKYGELYAADARGRQIPARLGVQKQFITWTVDDADATYPIAIDPVWSESHFILAEPATPEKMFGFDVALDGDYAVFGAPMTETLEPETGTAYVHHRDLAGTNSWKKVAELRSINSRRGDMYGYSVALDGEIAVVGARLHSGGVPWSGGVFVYHRDHPVANGWGLKAHHFSGAQYELMGEDVDIEGNLIAVGAPGYLDIGRAYVLSRDRGGADQWGIVRAFDSSAVTNSNYGSNVAISGDILAVSAHHDNADGVERAGAVYLYDRNFGGPDAWGLRKKLTPPKPEFDQGFGSAVDIVGERLFISASTSAVAQYAGSVYLFERNIGGANAWGLRKEIVPGEQFAWDNFGLAVSATATKVVITATEPGRSDVGAAHVFGRDTGGNDNWGEIAKLLPTHTLYVEGFGESVSLGEREALIGAGATNHYGYATGAAFLFPIQLSPGATCSIGSDCLSGFCIDSVCCETSCGGGIASDCMACSVAAGATTDGVCGTLADGVSCTDGLFCNGADSCAAGLCVVHDMVDPCGKKVADGDDDCSEACNEETDSCTAIEPDGAPCSDGVFCNGEELCKSGLCGESPGDPCPGTDRDDNCRESCDETNRSCTGNDLNDTLCDDGIFCNGLDACRDGQCLSLGTKPCPGPDDDVDCKESCSENGRTCDAPDPDGSSCGSGMVCRVGSCAIAPGAKCGDSEQCSTGYCVEGVCCYAESCGTFRCGADGLCLSTCVSGADCIGGASCESNGECAVLDSDVGSEQSSEATCGCRVPARPSLAGMWGGLLVVVARRSRKRRLVVQ